MCLFGRKIFSAAFRRKGQILRPYTLPVISAVVHRLFVAACLVGISESANGCLSASPPIAPGFDGSVAGEASSAGWADTVIGYTDGATTVSCTEEIPACGVVAPGCAAGAALGPPDGQTFIVAPGENIVIAFRCAIILDHGGGEEAPDFTVWATVADGGSAVVDVGPDGRQFSAVGTLTEPNQSFSLSRVGQPLARFLRITNVGASDVLLDAVEAL
jgi:hypothetical protein